MNHKCKILILIAVCIVLASILVAISILATPNDLNVPAEQTGFTAHAVISENTISTRQLNEAHDSFSITLNIPVTGVQPVDDAVLRLINEAVAGFKYKATGEGSRKGSTEESMNLSYQIYKLTDEEIDIVFQTDVVHCGFSRDRRAALTFSFATGEVLYASDTILPDLSLPRSKRMAITFDDGPSKITPYLLDALQKRGYHVTFFVLGASTEAYPKTVLRAYEEGHQIATHTYSHKNLNQLSVEEIQSEVQKGKNAIMNAGVPSPTALRAPYGNANTRVRNSVDVPLINWTIDTLDWKHKNAKKLETAVLKDARDGAIVLCHDTRFCTVEGIISAMDKLAAKGYEFVTVDELLFSDTAAVAGKVYRIG